MDKLKNGCVLMRDMLQNSLSSDFHGNSKFHTLQAHPVWVKLIEGLEKTTLVKYFKLWQISKNWFCHIKRIELTCFMIIPRLKLTSSNPLLFSEMC